MIGDWVLIDESSCKIRSLTELNEYSALGEYAYLYIGHTKYVKGIPLTPEILEKNGWIQCKYETCKSLYEYKGLHLRHTMIKRSNGRWVANVEGIVEKFPDEYTHSFLRINVFYVHELQHTLRLCGLNELADNFKI